MLQEREVFSPSVETVEEEGTAPKIEPLTPRQREILILAACGLSYEEIAKKLGLSYETIKSHFFHQEPRGIFPRLNAHSETEAVSKALKYKEITLEEILARGKFNLSAYSALSPREVEVLEKFVDLEGKAGDKNLAESLGISRKTIINHFYSIHGKLGAGNRAQAMVFTLAVKAEKANRLTSSQPIQ